MQRVIHFEESLLPRGIPLSRWNFQSSSVQTITSLMTFGHHFLLFMFFYGGKAHKKEENYHFHFTPVVPDRGRSPKTPSSEVFFWFMSIRIGRVKISMIRVKRRDRGVFPGKRKKVIVRGQTMMKRQKRKVIF